MIFYIIIVHGLTIKWGTTFPNDFLYINIMSNEEYFNTILNSISILQTRISKIHTNNLSPKPMLNFGNTCYLNSILQILFNHPIIIDLSQSDVITYLRHNSKYKQIIVGAKLIELSLLYILSDTDIPTDIMNHPSKEQSSELQIQNQKKFFQELSNFKIILGHFNAEFNGSHQNDQHELLCCLFNILHESFCHEIDMPESVYQLPDCKNFINEALTSEIRKKTCESIISQHFTGQILQRTHCQVCQNVSKVYSTFKILELPINVECDSSVIESRLCYFMKITDLMNENVYACDTCRTSTNAKQRYTLWHLPKVLIISLKRFTENIGKDTSCFKYSEQIDLNDYCSVSNEPIIYQLQAMACHYGSLQRGHCISRIRNATTGEWFEINDDVISKWNGQSNGSEIYMLVYNRLTD